MLPPYLMSCCDNTILHQRWLQKKKKNDIRRWLCARGKDTATCDHVTIFLIRTYFHVNTFCFHHSISDILYIIHDKEYSYQSLHFEWRLFSLCFFNTKGCRWVTLDRVIITDQCICLPNEYKYLSYSNYSNNGYSNENFIKHRVEATDNIDIDYPGSSKLV